MRLQFFIYFFCVATLANPSSVSNTKNTNVLEINGEVYNFKTDKNESQFRLNSSVSDTNYINYGTSSFNSPNSDTFVDLILTGARKLIKDQGLDPAKLPDAIAKFSKVILGIKIWGDAKVWNGHFSGLSTITRTGPTSLEPKEDKMQLTANIGVRNANAGYSASAEFMKLGVKAKASVDIRDINVYLAAEVPMIPGAHLRLTTLKITDIGKLKVHFHGLGPLDWVVESLSSFIGNLIRDWLSKVLQGPLKDIIQQMLDNLPIP